MKNKVKVLRIFQRHRTVIEQIKKYYNIKSTKRMVEHLLGMALSRIRRGVMPNSKLSVYGMTEEIRFRGSAYMDKVLAEAKELSGCNGSTIFRWELDNQEDITDKKRKQEKLNAESKETKDTANTQTQ